MADISQSFAQGVSQGQAASQNAFGLAFRQLNLDMQKEELAAKKEQLQAQAQEAQLKKGLKVFEVMDKISKYDDPKLRKANMNFLAQITGSDLHELSQAFLDSDTGRKKLQDAFVLANKMQYSGDPKMTEAFMQTVMSIAEVLPTENLEKGVDTFLANVPQMFRLKETQDFQAQENAKDRELKERELNAKLAEMKAKSVKEATDMEFQKGEFSQKIRKELQGTDSFTRYAELRVQTRNLFNAFEKPGAFSDLGILMSFMKVLDPGSVVRESEGKLFIEKGNFSDKFKNAVEGIQTGKNLQPAQRKEIVEEAARRLSQEMGNYSDTRSAAIKSAESLGLDNADPGSPLLQADRDFLEERLNKGALGERVKPQIQRSLRAIFPDERAPKAASNDPKVMAEEKKARLKNVVDTLKPETQEKLKTMTKNIRESGITDKAQVKKKLEQQLGRPLKKDILEWLGLE